MVSPALTDTFQKVAVSVLTAVLTQVLLEVILKRIRWATLVKRFRVALLVSMTAAAFCGLYFFVSPKPGVWIDPIGRQPPAGSLNGSSRYDIVVTGYVTHWNGDVYLVVKPLGSDSYWVQAPAVPTGLAENGRANWIGHAVFWTNAAGDGEEFNIYAIATSAKYQGSDYVGGERVPVKPDGFSSEVRTLTCSTTSCVLKP